MAVAGIVGLLNDGRTGVIRRWTVCSWWWRWFIDDPNVYDHVVSKILISGDEGVSLFILETNAFRTTGTSVETIEVLDSGHD